MPDRPKVLLVDDEIDLVRTTAKLLRARGVEADAVRDGQGALDRLTRDDYDVVVLDLKMPGMDGITTLRRMNQMGVRSRVLILTGNGTIDTALEAMGIGAHDYLAKPCDIEELLEKIDDAWKLGLRPGARAAR